MVPKWGLFGYHRGRVWESSGECRFKAPGLYFGGYPLAIASTDEQMPHLRHTDQRIDQGLGSTGERAVEPILNFFKTMADRVLGGDWIAVGGLIWIFIAIVIIAVVAVWIRRR